MLVHDIVAAKLEFWNWKNIDWQDSWDTTQADGQKGWLPSRVRITITVKGPDDKEVKIVHRGPDLDAGSRCNFDRNEAVITATI